ncbi:MAG TPA: CPBP family intramembrane glutamic endopeptidase [Bacteroidales bacterium]|nr:CPBP family intramembrane glutamic endopeptidase [Bacteroidales bacterium]
MGGNIHKLNLSGFSPFVQLIISLAIVLGIGILLMLLLLIPGFLIFHSDLSGLVSLSGAAGQEDIDFLRYMLIVQDIALFIVPSLIIMILLRSENQSGLSDLKLPRTGDLVLVILLAFSLIPITDFTGRLNAGLHLPQWMSGLEQKMVKMEDDADGMIDRLIVSENIRTLAMNLFMIALLPAVGEEFIFRGVFQKILQRLFHSGNGAVWVTAVIFSAIHFQFLGFIPRLILGLVFGYLFLWSGNLWLSILAHFVNNAIPVVGTYLHFYENSYQPVGMPSWNQALLLLFPVIVCAGILFYVRNTHRGQNINEINETP